MKIGIVGLPNVGKSTLFNALTNSYAADAANFPFCTIEPNIGMVDVKDPRIDALAELSKSQKKVPANIKFVDIAGLVKGASKGEGMGNKFLSNIKEVDAIVQVVRYFKDTNVSHVEGSVGVTRDAETINIELILADLEQVEKKMQGLTAKVKGKQQDAIKELALLEKLQKELQSEKLLHDSSAELTDEEKKILKHLNLMTAKPFIYAINVGLEDLVHAHEIQKEFSDTLHKPIAIVCAKLEHDMIGLNEQEKNEFLQDATGGHTFEEDEKPTLDTLIKLAYDSVGLMYYFTTGEKETKAWAIPKNSTAPQAAGAIHTDFEKGFIKAEVVHCDQLIEAGSRSKAKELGKVRLEGKEYVVKDGDTMIFKFNVSK